MKNILLVFVFISGSALASPYPQYAQNSVAAIWQGAQNCGLLRMDAYDPRLPQPQVPADEAVVNTRGRVIAYSISYFGAGAWTTFKNPQGGWAHTVAYGREGIKYVTPLQGTIGHGNRVMTVNGPAYPVYCQSQPVTHAAFSACVQQLFIGPIVAQLCQFATP